VLASAIVRRARSERVEEELIMATRFAEQLHQGMGIAETLVEAAREALPPDAATRIDESIGRAVRRARRGVERATDVRDEARMVIKRHPFGVTALALGVGTVLGVAVGRLAGRCAARAEPPSTGTAVEDDIEC
jgi:hypothetical protein